MIWRSHRIVTGITVFAYTQSLLATFVAVTGSTFPDNLELNLSMKHRSTSHWFPCYLIPATLLALFYKEFPLALSANDLLAIITTPDPSIFIPAVLRSLLFWFFIGCLFHILEDTLTGYVPITSPRDQRKWWHPFYTGSLKEDFFVLVYTLGLGAILVLRYSSANEFAF